MNAEEREILKIIKKHVYVCGQEENKHLAFKNISIKKDKEAFDKLVAFLNKMENY